MKQIDLNCDMGESYGVWRMGRDAEIMPFVTSANVACGAHAGDPNVMAATVRMAREHGVAVGAHPGYPDLAGFGRRPMALTPDEITRWLLAQIGALWAIARSEGVELCHVKPHGALYNEAARDEAVAYAVVRAVKSFSPLMPLVCLTASIAAQLSQQEGLTTLLEGFADRAYQPNGSLAHRQEAASVYSSPQVAAAQAVQLAEGSVTALDGSTLRVQVDTICVHSDTPNAPAIAQEVGRRLREAGYQVAALGILRAAE
ncbi:MAG: LamB/YcsF family protein [Chloroflexi bacterium]|nr:LamB/YcsF family protein [Chloroflexota bacterium]